MITILDDALVNKIAAGEVVERPASVVKELVENSIDAEATEILIKIEVSGKKSISIRDNGIGMSESDLLICFKRHATSKIKTEKDLFEINSLGFRGEALAAISEISNTKIVSKQKDAEHAISIEIEAGQVVKKQITGAPNGTSIIVSDLFFNVPARKKYMKSDEVELDHIIRIVTQYALLHKEISFKLVHNGKDLLVSPSTDSMLTNLMHIYGPEIGDNLLAVDYEKNGMKLVGFISKPQLTRSDASHQSLFINGRYVSNKIISDAIYEAYHTLLFINRHPVFVLNFFIDPKEIDVNVHPSKKVIRLKNGYTVRDFFIEAIKAVFDKNDLMVKASVEKETTQQAVSDYSFSKDRQSILVKEEGGEYSSNGNAFNNKDTINKNLEEEEKRIGPFAILGQVNKMYIIAESPKGLAVVDQHAAEERVNYELFMKQLQNGAIKKQKLVQARVSELTPAQYQIAMSYKSLLERIGFDYEDFGNNTVKVTAIPEIFGRLKSTLFFDILHQLPSTGSATVEKEIEDRIVRFSCRASVKAGEELTKPQMDVLLSDLAKCENPFSCPHGRPTVIELSLADFEKKFKRSGW